MEQHHRHSAAPRSPHHAQARILVPPSPLLNTTSTRSPAKRTTGAGPAAFSHSRSTYAAHPGAPKSAHRSSLLPTFGKVNRSIPSFSTGAKRAFLPTPAVGFGGGGDEGWDTMDEDDEDEAMRMRGYASGGSATAVELDDVESSSDESFFEGEDGAGGGAGGWMRAGGAAEMGGYGAPPSPLSAEATAALRALKTSPLALAPGVDYDAFVSLYSTALGRAKDLFAFCSEDVKEGLLVQVETLEKRALKAMDVLDAEKDKLIGAEATARQKKAADLTTRLSALHAQVLQNRETTKMDLAQIRDSTQTRLSSLSTTFRTQQRKLDSQLKKAMAASAASGGGAGGGGGGLAGVLKAAGLGLEGFGEGEGGKKGAGGGGGKGRKR